MLLKRVFEVDPLKCPHCGGRMKIIGFIERRQQDVIERIGAPLRPVGMTDSHPGQSARRREAQRRRTTGNSCSMKSSLSAGASNTGL